MNEELQPMSRVRVVRNMLTLGALSSVIALTLTATVAGASVLAPQRVRATGTATTILVSWSRPPGAAVKTFSVISKPAGRSCVTATTHCDVKGLHPGVSYSFSVVARGVAGTSAPSVPSNRVKVATSRDYFSKTLIAGSTQIAKYESDFENSTAAKAAPYLTKLSGAFASLAKSLSIESWPARARGDMSSFVTTFRALGADTIKDFNASTYTALAGATYALQSDTNKEILVESKVRTDLSLPQLIISPIAGTPAPVALGTTQTIHDFYNDPLSVTVSQVFDPASAAAGAGLPDAGYRFVAVLASLVNNSTEEISDDADFTMTVTGTDGQTYTADFGSVSQCTGFQYNSGFFDLAPGDSTSGCVIFQVPTAVSVQTISFSLAQGYLDTAEWSN
jgi:Fibronectin type III domain/Domain of unknown function (DUF4352)